MAWEIFSSVTEDQQAARSGCKLGIRTLLSDEGKREAERCEGTVVFDIPSEEITEA